MRWEEKIKRKFEPIYGDRKTEWRRKKEGDGERENEREKEREKASNNMLFQTDI